jgi:hypothetical protein
MTTQTNLLTLLVSNKPNLYTASDAPVSRYSDVWAALLAELPTMYKNGEEWAYHHRARDVPCYGTDAKLQDEFANLERQGLELMDDSELNNKNIYVIIPHPKLKKVVIRCDFSFKRFLGKERDDSPPLGAGLCPWLFALGAYADGATYVRVKFSIIRKSDVPSDESLLTLKRNKQEWSVSE